MKKLFTSEAVTKGHPDKICDQIADAVLDEMLRQDPLSRSACEVTAESGAVHIMGEITTNAEIDYEGTARRVIKDIGYTKAEYGFSYDSVNVTCSVHKQSADIAAGVDSSMLDESTLGAGDQGMMFGYATTEGENYMPLGVVLSRKLTQVLTLKRENKEISWLRPDGKAQVSVEYDESERPRRVEAIVLSAQHDEDISLEKLRETLKKEIILASIDPGLIDKNTKFFINPTGRFVIGGPAGDTGLTGRKLVVDTYGGYAHHGGGSFSGKDATKVDRTAAIALRNVAKTIVASGVARECEIQVAYAIGVAQPVSLSITESKDCILPYDTIISWVKEYFDLRPEKMIERFKLRNPVFLSVASGGTFGRTDVETEWEIIDEKALKALKSLIK